MEAILPNPKSVVGISEGNFVPLAQAMDTVEGIADRSSLENPVNGEDVPGPPTSQVIGPPTSQVPDLQTSQVAKTVIGSDKIDIPMTQMVDAANTHIQPSPIGNTQNNDPLISQTVDTSWPRVRPPTKGDLRHLKKQMNPSVLHCWRLFAKQDTCEEK